MPKGQSPTHELAYWFWDEILDKGLVVLGAQTEFWSAPRRWTARYLAEAKRAINDELDIAVLKASLRRMVAEGVQPMDLLLPTKWRMGDDIYYDAILKEAHTPPPIYDKHAFRIWCQEYGREDMLKLL